MTSSNRFRAIRYPAILFLIGSIHACSGGGDNESSSDSNSLPAANAGIDQSVNEYDTVQLSGNGVDSDGTITSYLWEQISGTTVNFADPDSPQTTFIASGFESDESLQFSLTVIDNDGGSAVDLVNVSVTANSAPDIYLGSNSMEVFENTSISLETSSSDTDGEVVSRLWTQTSGPIVEIFDETDSQLRFTSPEIDETTELVFNLTATDDDDESSSQFLTIIVNPSFFDVILSDSFDTCGNRYSQEIVFTFFDELGSPNEFFINHEGYERSYSFDVDNSDSPKTLKVEKEGWDTIIVNLDPNTPIFLNAFGAFEEDCGCQTYDISTVGTSNTDTIRLWVNGSRISGTLNTWTDVEICPEFSDRVYVVNQTLEKFSKVNIAGNSEVLVSDFTPLASIDLLPFDSQGNLTTTSFFSANTNNFGSSNQNLSYLANVDTFQSEITSLNFINDSSITYLEGWARINNENININLAGTPSFSLNNFTQTFSPMEVYRSAFGVDQLTESIEIEVFDFSSIDIYFDSDSLSFDSSAELSFDAAHMVFLPLRNSTGQPTNTFDWLEIISPIDSGEVDYSSIATATGDIEGFDYVSIQLTDLDGSENYQDTLPQLFSKRTTSFERTSKSIQFGVIDEEAFNN